MAAPAFLWFLLAIAAAAMMARGALVLAAMHRVELRIARLVSPLAARPLWAGPKLPHFLAPRGRDASEIARELREAGIYHPRAIEYFLWLRLAATGAAMGLVGLANLISTGAFLSRPVPVILAGAATYLLSKRLLHLLKGMRQRAITAEFPFLLDLMQMMLESGLSLDQCFRSIATEESEATPRLAATMRRLVFDLDRGMSYDAALGRWAERTAVGGAKELASLFQQALMQGTELAPALKTFTREFTERRIAHARESIGRISVQMVLVLIACFLPAIFIVVGGPPVASLFDMIQSEAR
jgi:tight adherence protein C